MDLETSRLNLRIFTISDITPEYVQSLNNPEIIGLTESRYRNWSMEQVKEYVLEKGNKKGDSMLIGIFLKDSNQHIGNIRLHSFSDYNKRVEMGIMIWDKSKWGQGYSSEALAAVANYIFDFLKLDKICAEYYAINKASAKIFKKLGFEIEGVFKNHFLVKGKYINAIRVAKFRNKK